MGFLAGVEVAALKTVKGNKAVIALTFISLTVKIKAFFLVHTK